MGTCNFSFLITGLHVVILRLRMRPFLGLVSKAASTPVEFITALWSIWHLTIRLFILTSFIPIPWVFACVGFSAVSNLVRLLWAPLHYLGSLAL